MKIRETLNRPYPLSLNKWKTTIFVSIFISFFLSVFQPFGLQFLHKEHKTIILLGYGAVTFLLLLFNSFLLPIIFKKHFKEETWTVGKQILHLACVLLTISLGNYGYSVIFSIFQWVGYKGILFFLLFTFPIAMIPMVIIVFITQNVYLKKNLIISAQINEEVKKKTAESNNVAVITFKSGIQEVQFPLNTIIFLESEGNYINVNYLDNGLTKSKLIRNTLKNIYQGIPEKDLFMCHRAFVINTQYIEKNQRKFTWHFYIHEAYRQTNTCFKKPYKSIYTAPKHY